MDIEEGRGILPLPELDNSLNTNKKIDFNSSNRIVFTETVPFLRCLETTINSEADLTLLSQIDVPASLIPEIQKTVQQGFYVQQEIGGEGRSTPVVISSNVASTANKLLESLKIKATKIWSSTNHLSQFISTDVMPFTVYIESNDKNIGQLRDMYVGKLLFQNGIEGVSKIARKGRNRVGVEFSSLKQANNFLNSEFPKKNNLKAFIPQHLISCKGIIREIDPSLSVESILKNIKASNNCPVLGVQRMLRKKEIDGKVQFVNTASVIISFRGKNLPQYVTLFYNVRVPEAYVAPVIQCSNCCRYGHLSKQCRSNVRCPACSDNHELSSCPARDNPACVFCKGDHFSNESNTRLSNRVCPEFHLQKEIKVHMARYNCSVYEASMACRKNNLGSPELNRNLIVSDSNFPALVTEEEYPISQLLSSQISTNRLPPVRKHFSFSKVLNKKPSQQTKRKSDYNEDYILYKNGRIPDSLENPIVNSQTGISPSISISDIAKNNVIIKLLREAFVESPRLVSDFIKEFIPSTYHNNLQWLSSLQSTQAQIH